MRPDVLEGRIALVTGAGGALGKPIGLELARQGATVVLGLRDPVLGAELAGEISALTDNDRIEVLELDLASLSSVRRAAAEFQRRHDRLHILVNNTATGARRVTDGGHALTTGANHLGRFLLTNLLLDTLKASAPARVVTMSMPARAPAALASEARLPLRLVFKLFGGSLETTSSQPAPSDLAMESVTVRWFEEPWEPFIPARRAWAARAESAGLPA